MAGDASLDYDANFDRVTFFTQTLEFVFAASDLVEAGWDIKAWSTTGTTMFHPFARYRINYATRASGTPKRFSRKAFVHRWESFAAISRDCAQSGTSQSTRKRNESFSCETSNFYQPLSSFDCESQL